MNEVINIVMAVLMFVLPPVFALGVHVYLRHGEVSGRKRLAFFGFYFVLMNLITFGVSWIRGVKGLDLTNMTMSYKIKYLGLGIVLGFIVPFVVCLVVEDQITLGGLKRYIRRFVGDFCKYFSYAVRAAKADLKAEVKGSFLDWLWWMIEPFCSMIIYTIIFGFVFNTSEDYFPAFIFIGITIWGFFSRSVNGSVNMVRSNKGIITKVYMPKYILLLSKMFVNGFKMIVSFGVTAVLMIFLRVPLHYTIVYFIPVILVTFAFTFGVGTIMMHYGVFVNDLGYITGIVLNMLMYLSGPFYAVGKRIPQPFGEILEKFNPIAFLMSQMRNALLYGISPDWGMLGIWAFISLALIALGCFTVYHNENAYVKVI